MWTSCRLRNVISNPSITKCCIEISPNTGPNMKRITVMLKLHSNHYNQMQSILAMYMMVSNWAIVFCVRVYFIPNISPLVVFSTWIISKNHKVIMGIGSPTNHRNSTFGQESVNKCYCFILILCQYILI